MKTTVYRREYPLVFPFRLSYSTYYSRTGILVKVQEEDFNGYGELSIVPYYHKDEAKLKEDLDKISSFLEEIKGDWHPEDLYEKILNDFSPDLAVLSAVDCALYDLYGKKNGVPIWEVVKSQPNPSVESSLTITSEDWIEKLNWDWPVLKLKMGFSGDMELLKEVRNNYDGPLRVDVNAGWTLDQLMKNIDKLVEAKVEMIEQPLKPGEDDLLKKLSIPLNIFADESVQDIDSLDKMAEFYDGINIKLQKCGGITPALRMIRKAQELDLKLMAGCMTESSVGIGAMAHLASFFDFLDLDGEYLIDNDFGNEKFIDKGKIVLTPVSGIGCDFNLK